MTPDTITPTEVLTSESWEQFFGLVAELRRVQLRYRRTIDPRARRQAEQLESRLDVTIARFTSAMHAAAVEVEAAAAIAVEGGAA